MSVETRNIGRFASRLSSNSSTSRSGSRIRQRAQHDGVHDAEDGRAAADPQRDREQGRGRHEWRARKQAERVANVLHQHAEVFPRRTTEDVGEHGEPEPQEAFVPGAIAVEVSHLRPELVPELARVQPQQLPEERERQGFGESLCTPWREADGASLPQQHRQPIGLRLREVASDLRDPVVAAPLVVFARALAGRRLRR